LGQLTVGAIVLATADTGFGDPAKPGSRPSSLVEVAGEPLARRVVRALREAVSIGPVVVVCDPSATDALGADRELPGGETLADDLLAALTAVGECAHAVILPGDVAFVTGAEIDAFVAAALGRGVQTAYPMVPRGVCEAAFPDIRRTYFRLAEGELTGASALYLEVPTFLGNPRIIGEAVELRREPWRLALMVDPRVLFAYTAGHLSVTAIEAAAEKALGIRLGVLVLDAPGLATDIQKPIDLRAARGRLEGGGRTT
jgi:2-phospho-L-lactate guanylyltransferase (CobY/MobA/RfbA family)